MAPRTPPLLPAPLRMEPTVDAVGAPTRPPAMRQELPRDVATSRHLKEEAIPSVALVTNSFLFLLVRHLLLLAWHLLLLANIVTTSKALVTRSDALVTSSFLFL